MEFNFLDRSDVCQISLTVEPSLPVVIVGPYKNTKGDDAAPVASSPSVIVVALSVASLSFAMISGAPVPPITA